MKKKVLRRIADNSTIKSKPEYENLEFYIILVEPEGSANVGSIARSMKNFGFKNLILFNPKCSYDSDMRKYSMHARKDILEKAEFIHLDRSISHNEYIKELKSLLQRYNYVIATSSKPGMFRNIKRIPFFVDELDFSYIGNQQSPKEKNGDKNKIKIAIVFGRESQGLSNEELSLCDFAVKIQASDDYPSLNLSHAAAIVLFTIFKKIRVIRKGTIIPSTKKQKEILFENIEEVLRMLEFPGDVSDKILNTFSNLLGRSFSSMKEVNLILTLFKRIQNIEKILEKSKNKPSNDKSEEM